MPTAKTLRPKVTCLMATTLDGKILGSRWGNLPAWGKTNVFEVIHKQLKVPAWVVGTTTMSEFAGKPQRLKKAPATFTFDDFVAQPGASSFGIGADAKGKLRFQSSETQGDHVVVLTTRAAGLDYLAHLRAAGVSYLVCGDRELDLPLAFSKLRSRLGLKHVLLEGGGIFNGAVLRAGLVDNVEHLLIPVIDAGGPKVTANFDAPDTFKSKHAATTLTLQKSKTLKGGIVHLTYKVRPKAG